MRIIAFILLFVLSIANLVGLDTNIIVHVINICSQMLKRRLPPTNAPGGLLNLRAFKSAAFTIYCISAFVIFLGLYTGRPPSFLII